LIETTLKGETKAMYEKPELTQVGDARDTILGLSVSGYDVDGQFIYTPTQFESESISQD
jgi:hypothetical protein